METATLDKPRKRRTSSPRHQRGAVIARGSKWCIKYRMPDGRQKWETVGTDKEQAVKLLRKRLTSMDSGDYVESKFLTFGEFADKWLKALDGDVVSGQLSPSTRATYGYVLERHLRPHFGDRPLQQISRIEVKQFLSTKKDKAPKTVRNILRVMSRLFGDALEDGYANFNPAQIGGRKKGAKAKDTVRRTSQTRVPSPAELQAFFTHVEPPDFPILLTIALVGIRRGEAVALQWGDVDAQGGALRVRRSWCRYAKKFKSTKTGNERRIDLGPAACQLFASLLAERGGKYEPADLIFLSPTGGLIDPDALSKRFRKAVKRAGLEPFTPHSLRHLYDSAGLRVSNGDIKWVQAQMGHATSQMTMDTYGHLLSPSRPELAKETEAIILGEFREKLLGSGADLPC